MITGAIPPAESMYAQFRSIAEGVCRADPPEPRCIPPPPRPLRCNRGRSFMSTGAILPAGPMYAQFRSIAEGVCCAYRSGSRCIPPPPRPLQARNSPPTHQIRHVMEATGFTTHSIQVMHRKRAGPRCPSTQTAAGAKSPCGRLQARPRVRLQLFAAALARPSPG